MGTAEYNVAAASSGTLPTPIFKFLRRENTDQDSNANGDFALDTDGAGAGEFVYEALVPVRIERLLVLIVDNGVIGVSTYGALSELTNGIIIDVKRDNQSIFDLCDGVPVKSNAAWQRLCFDVSINDKGAGNDGYIGVRWTFERAGYPVRLVAGDKFVVTVQDDLSGLMEHRFMIQGFEESTDR